MRFLLFAAALVAADCSSATGRLSDRLGLDPRLDSVFIRGGRWADVGKTCTDAAQAVSVPASRFIPYSHYSDDRWAALARTVPGGFGGLLINHGAYTIYLVDTTKFPDAADAVAAAGLRRPTTFLHGRWDFGQMFDWAGVIWHNWPPTAGPTSFDINEATNRLEFGAADSAGLKSLDKTFASMDLPCRLVWLNIQTFSFN